MTKLMMGERFISPTKTDANTIDPKIMQRHMFVTGQSGSGKSTLVGRLVEEIVLRDTGNVLFLDCNFEFSQFSDVNKDSFKETYNRKNCPEDDEEEFSKAWDTKKSGIQTIKASEVNIIYRNIDFYLKVPLLGIDRDKHPGTYWLLQMIEEHDILKNNIKNKNSLLEIINTISRWCEGRTKESENKKYGIIIHEMRRNLSALDLTRFANAAKNLRKQKYINFKSVKDKKKIDEVLVNSLFDSTYFCSLDLLNFSYDLYHYRDFTVLYILYCIWKEAKRRFIERKTTGSSDKPKPLFIVIDEAHNIAPSNGDHLQSPISNEVGRIVRTIAAEGRKFGLFLILISQRPDKIDDNIISECDNFIIMKSTPPTIGRLADYIGPKSDNRFIEKLEPAISFEKGQAFYCGAVTSNREIQIVEGDIKRTK